MKTSISEYFLRRRVVSLSFLTSIHPLAANRWQVTNLEFMFQVIEDQLQIHRLPDGNRGGMHRVVHRQRRINRELLLELLTPWLGSN
jgi:hypothetical protein